MWPVSLGNKCSASESQGRNLDVDDNHKNGNGGKDAGDVGESVLQKASLKA